MRDSSANVNLMLVYESAWRRKSHSLAGSASLARSLEQDLWSLD